MQSAKLLQTQLKYIPTPGGRKLRACLKNLLGRTGLKATGKVVIPAFAGMTNRGTPHVGFRSPPRSAFSDMH